MLLPRLQCEGEAYLAIQIQGATNDSPWHLPDLSGT